MRRNPELFRKLMLAIEQTSQPLTDETQIDGYSRDEVAYHMHRIIEAGFAEGRAIEDHSGGNTTVPNRVVIFRMTNAGHDFIDNIRDDTVWRDVRKRLTAVGGSAAVEVIKQLGAAALKAHLGLP